MTKTRSADTERRDPFLFDMDRLLALASEPVVRRGVAYFKDNRVLELGWDEGRLWAEVEGSVSNLPYAVDVALDEDQEPLVCCTCPFDLEPACKHVVAALLAYAARVETRAVESAAEQAIHERQQRGRTQVKVAHRAGMPSFGSWSAWSVTAGGQKLKPYTVHIRSTKERMNVCSCPDFGSNRLGTCKHIEAVLHRLKKRRLDAPAPALAVVYLSWQTALASGEPHLAVHLPQDAAPELRAFIDRHFDGSGRLRAALPEAWTALERECAERADVHLGDDAKAFAMRLAIDQAHVARRERIRAEIARTGGHLPGVRARLYPYQIEGVAFLASTGRALLADDMGLGKTLQAIAAARWLIDNEGIKRVLVVCPASLKTQWQREIHRFTGLDALVIEGGAAGRLAQYRRGVPFLICNYELVVRDLEVLATELAPDLLILDEAQRIKNWRTKTAAAVKGLQTRYAFVLSGTPLENRLEDLYSVMQVIDGRVLGPLWQYLVQFHVTDERGKVVAYRNLSELRKRLAPVMLRRDKRLVREQLPSRTVQTIPVPLSARQRELHDAALLSAQRFARIMQRRPLTPSEEKQLLASLQTARMACNAAGLVDQETVGSPKLDELARILEAVCVDGGGKIVVFSQWERMTRMAAEVAAALGLGVVRLHGGVPAQARGALIDRFRDDAATQVFLSTDAGATGLNLQNASVFVNLDMPWNPAVLEQRIGRVHRLGQREPVHAYLLVTELSYEERVASLVKGKAELFTTVIEPDASDDVVVVEKRLLEAAVEAIGLDETRPRSDEEDEPLPELGDEAAPTPELTPAQGAEPATSPPRVEREVEAEREAWVAAAVREAEEAFAGHIEEMVARDRGLIVIVTTVRDGMHGRAAMIGGPVPVAVMDRRTWLLLEQMGHGAVREPTAPVPPPTEPPLIALARRRLSAADVLIEQAMPSQALELLAAAMLAHAAANAGRETAPEGPSAAMWIFAEALPRGYLPEAVAHAIIKAQSFAHADGVPAALLDDVARTARAFIGADRELDRAALPDPRALPNRAASAPG